MMISTRGRYALRVMIDLAERYENGYVSLGEIAKRQELSGKYLESIIATFTKAGLVEGVRGKGGGYRLVKKTSEYTAGEILRLAEGPLAPVACLSEPERPCHRAADCRTLPLWQGLDKLVSEYLDSVTLEDLINGMVSGKAVSGRNPSEP